MCSTLNRRALLPEAKIIRQVPLVHSSAWRVAVGASQSSRIMESIVTMDGSSHPCSSEIDRFLRLISGVAHLEDRSLHFDQSTLCRSLVRRLQAHRDRLSSL